MFYPSSGLSKKHTFLSKRENIANSRKFGILIAFVLSHHLCTMYVCSALKFYNISNYLLPYVCPDSKCSGEIVVCIGLY